MRKAIVILLAAFGALATFAVIPEISNVYVEQDRRTRLVTVTYDLADANAVVTVDFTTNGVSIGAVNFTNVEESVNCAVAQGNGRRITWRPDKSWPDRQITESVFGA